MRNLSIDPSTRLKAIELDVVLITTILKIKYEGKAFIKGLGTLVEKSKQLHYKQKEKGSENEIRRTVTTGIYPNDFITFPSSSQTTNSNSGLDPQAKSTPELVNKSYFIN
jgi:hypothetical protein